MFYAILGLWIIACIIGELLTHLRQAVLSNSSSGIALAGVVGGLVLLTSGHQYAGIAVLAGALYVWAIIRWSIHKQNTVTIKA